MKRKFLENKSTLLFSFVSIILFALVFCGSAFALNTPDTSFLSWNNTTVQGYSGGGNTQFYAGARIENYDNKTHYVSFDYKIREKSEGLSFDFVPAKNIEVKNFSDSRYGYIPFEFWFYNFYGSGNYLIDVWVSEIDGQKIYREPILYFISPTPSDGTLLTGGNVFSTENDIIFGGNVSYAVESLYTDDISISLYTSQKELLQTNSDASGSFGGLEDGCYILIGSAEIEDETVSTEEREICIRNEDYIAFVDNTPVPNNTLELSEAEVEVIDNIIRYHNKLKYFLKSNVDYSAADMTAYLYDSSGDFLQSSSFDPMNWAENSFGDLEDGSYTIYAEATNYGGVTVSTEYRTIRILNPFYAYLFGETPLNGTITNKPNVMIEAKTNRGSALKNFSVTVYNQSDESVVMEKTIDIANQKDFNEFISFNNTFPDGVYRIFASATTWKNITRNDTRIFTIDTIPPEAYNITSSPELNFSENVPGGTYFINFVPSEELKSVALRLIYSNGTSKFIPLQKILLSNGISVKFDLPSIEAGNASLNLTLSDLAGNSKRYAFSEFNPSSLITGSISLIQPIDIIYQGTPYTGKLNLSLNDYNNINILLWAVNSTGNNLLVGNYSVDNQSDFPLNVIFPELALGNYNLILEIFTPMGEWDAYGIDSFEVRAAPVEPIVTPQGGGGGGGGGGGSGITVYVNNTNQTGVPDFFAGNRSTEGNESEEEEGKGFFAGITGAVVGAWGNPNIRLAIYILIGIAIIYAIVMLRKRYSK